MANILHIDSDRTTYKIVDIALQGHSVRHTESGFEAITDMKSHIPDLLITELDLPLMDGYEIMERMHDIPALSAIPVVVLSNDKDVVTQERCAKYGTVEFIGKPFVPSMLEAKVNKVLDSLQSITRLSGELSAVKEKAERDALTGLWNKEYFRSRVSESLEKGNGGAVFMLDMDNFKSINDTYGHDAGDRVLRMFAHIMREAIDKGDLAARVGGDEFMLFCSGGVQNIAEHGILAERIINEFSGRIQAQGFQTNTSVSVGIAISGCDGDTYEELIKAADTALYAAKSAGKNTYRLACDERQENDARSFHLLTAEILPERLCRGDVVGSKAHSEDLTILSGIYRFLCRQEGVQLRLLLFTLMPSGIIADHPYSPAAEDAEGVLKMHLAKSDIYTSYSQRQFIVLMLNKDKNSAAAVAEKIVADYSVRESANGVKLGYEIL